jgi:hypothetical protein
VFRQLSSEHGCLGSTTWTSTQQALCTVERDEGPHLVAAGGDEHRRCHERGRPLQGGAIAQRSGDLQGTK